MGQSFFFLFIFIFDNWKKVKFIFNQVCMLSHDWLFATLWTVAHQVPLSMGFSRW